MCLTEDLAAASVPTDPPTFASPTVPTTATAHPVDWIASANGGAGGYYVDTTTTYNVEESTGLSSYTSGQWLLCRPVVSENGGVWEPVTGGGSPTISCALYPLPFSGNCVSGALTLEWNDDAVIGFTTTDNISFTIPDNRKYLVSCELSIEQDWPGTVTSAEPDALDVTLNFVGTASISLNGPPTARVGYITVPTYVGTLTGGPPATGVILTPTWNYEDMGARSLRYEFEIAAQSGSTIKFTLSGASVNGSGANVNIIAGTLNVTPFDQG
jgi:hypothetical protein